MLYTNLVMPCIYAYTQTSMFSRILCFCCAHCSPVPHIQIYIINIIYNTNHTLITYYPKNILTTNPQTLTLTLLQPPTTHPHFYYYHYYPFIYMFGSLGHSYNQHILLESILACSLLPHIFRLCSISTCRIRYIFHSYFIVCQGLISKYVFYICLYCMLITTALRLSAQ